MTPLSNLLTGSPYQGYAYAYPHKTAYRRFESPIDLERLWREERRDALFLYVHVPFCEMRCGFCNLFTQAGPKAGLPERFLSALRHEAEQVREALAPARFARLAVGGGTPTFLDLAGLETLFDIAELVMGTERCIIPISVETSPGTADADKVALLRSRGVTRISLGVQSFVESETAAVARPQRTAEVHAALHRIRAAEFPTLNIDLIYGLPGQTVDTWLDSVRAALEYRPEELYLYPLYVRPLTGLGKSGRAWDDQRLACYRAGRGLLFGRGYEQVSMRMFRAGDTPADAGPVYCCQEDGMVGLGCGARSYTRGLHYSGAYAVGARGVREILAAYLDRDLESFATAGYGFRLNREEQRRRFILQSLLQAEGLSESAYARRFAGLPSDHFPDFDALTADGLTERVGDRLRLTEAGLERSDAIGPWLYSEQVQALMRGYEMR